jgi:hypothetical protein
MKKVNLVELMGHPHTHTAIQQLAQGVDPRLVAAQLAGNALKDQIARSLGAPAQPAKKTDDVIDGEYTVINVTPGVKHRRKVG